MELVANRCQFTPWTVEQLVASYSGKASPHFALPSFQRDFVWKVDEQKKFIASVRCGLPVGCILLFAHPSENEVRYIVDGLQRCTSLAKYAISRFEHFDAGDIPEAELESVLAAVVPGLQHLKLSERNDAGAALRRRVVGFMRERKTFANADGFDPYNLFQQLHGKSLGSYRVETPYAGSIPGAIGGLLDRIRECLTIDDVQIPVIEFFGEREHLPLIFERLNSEGTKLNKYDVLAAQWSEAVVTFQQKEIAKEVKGRYADLIDLGLEYKGITQIESLSKREFLIYEFVVGLGRLLKKTFPRLYRPLKKSTEVDSIGFNLATLSTGKRIVELGELRPWLQAAFSKRQGDVPDVTAFAELLIDASSYVHEWLAPALDSELFKRKSKSPHTEFQIAAMVATVARSLIKSAVPFERDVTNDELDDLSETIPRHYWLELLGGLWKGSGDSRSFTRVKERAYFETVSRDLFVERLRTWHEESLTGKQKSIDAVTRGLVALAASYVGVGGLIDDKTSLEPIYSELENRYVLGNLRLQRNGEDLLVKVGAPQVHPDAAAEAFVAARFEWFSERIVDALYQETELEAVS